MQWIVGISYLLPQESFQEAKMPTDVCRGGWFVCTDVCWGGWFVARTCAGVVFRRKAGWFLRNRMLEKKWPIPDNRVDQLLKQRPWFRHNSFSVFDTLAVNNYVNSGNGRHGVAVCLLPSRVRVIQGSVLAYYRARQRA
jgi:hypothetical protein